MRLAKCSTPRRRSETRDLVRPIIVALNRLPGVRVVRNANLGPVVPWAKRFDPGARPIIAGLGVGSADVVGVVRMQIQARTDGSVHLGAVDHSLVPLRASPGIPHLVRLYAAYAAQLDAYALYGSRTIGRLFCLEVKLGKESGKRAGRLEDDQRRWLEAVRRFGGFCAVVYSVDEARACVESCRRGEDGSLPF